MPVTTRNKQKFSLPNKEIDSVVVQTNRKKTKVLKAYEESDDLKCNCWGRFGHRSSVHPVYWRTGIEYGYRNNQGWQHSFQTLFSMHNETMNIWTHLIGFFFTFLAIVAYFTNKDVLFSYAYPFIFNATNDFQSNNDLITHSVYGPYYFFSFIISSSICLLGSSMYHLFMCISPALHDRLLFLDVIGIALLVGSSYFPAIYLGFYCFETLKSVYLGMSFAVLTLGLLSTVLEIKLYGNPVRPFVFAGLYLESFFNLSFGDICSLVGLVLTGLIPCLHWLLIAPPIYRDELYFGIVGLFFWLGVTMYINNTKCTLRLNMQVRSRLRLLSV